MERTLDELDSSADWRTNDAEFAEQYVQNFGRVRGVVLHLVRSPALADDIAQEAFVRAWGARARFAPRARFSTWVSRIAVNASLDYLKSGRRRYEQPLTDLTPVSACPPQAERALIARQAELSVQAAIQSLAPMYREPLVLRDLEGLSYAEVSARTGLATSTLKMRVLRARRKIAAALLASGEWPELGRVGGLELAG